MPDLPPELIDLILDYFHYDIPSLLSCLWTCRAWYHSTRRYLNPPERYAVRDRASLDRISGALIMKKTRRFYADLQGLFVYGDITRTFAIRIRGEFLPRVDKLALRDADWEKHPPHTLLFRKLPRFASVTFLRLDHCRFHSSGQLRALIRALPNLKRLDLLRTEVGQPERVPTQQGFARSHLRLESVNLRGLTCHKARMDALTICCTRTEGVKLRVHMDGSGSWSDFMEFAQAIPCLRLTEIGAQFPCDGSDRAPHVAFLSLHFIHISVQKQPSRDMQVQLEELMRHSGRALTGFAWDNNRGDYMPSLAFNSNLRFLKVSLRIEGESLGMHRSYGTIATILSQLPTSLPQFCWVSIHLVLNMLSFDEPSSLESKTSLATFERIFNYPVHIMIRVVDDICDIHQEAFAKAARHVLTSVFAPYCERHGGRVKISLAYGTSEPGEYCELRMPHCRHPAHRTADALRLQARTLKGAGPVL